MESKHIDIVFDGPPGLDGGRFVEVEIGNDQVHYRSMRFGKWIDRGDGYWTLRLTQQTLQVALERLAL